MSKGTDNLQAQDQVVETITSDNVLSFLKTKAKPVVDLKPRFTTGIESIDKMFTSRSGSGMKAGNYILAGDPGCGKSTMALHILDSMKALGHVTVYLAYEGKDQIFEVMNRLGIQNIPSVVDETDGIMPDADSICTFVEILAEGNRKAKNKKPPVIVIDALKNINAGNGSTVGRRQAIQMLTPTVRDNDVIMIYVGHVSAETRGKKKKKIQGPSEILELCDTSIFFIDVTPAEEAGLRDSREITLKIEKNRHGPVREFEGFLLTEDGFVFPDDKKNVLSDDDLDIIEE